MGLGNVTKAIWTLLQGTTNPDVVALYNNLYQKLEGAKMDARQGMGNVYFVDGFNGDDGNDGLTPAAAFQSIAHALDQCVDDRSDYIYCYNLWRQDTYPIDVDVNAVHIIGVAGPDGYAGMSAPSDTAIFNFPQNKGDGSEIANFALGGFAGSTHGCIELQGDNNSVWIHDCSFGHLWSGACQDGIRILGPDVIHNGVIEDCWFHGNKVGCGTITRCGIYAHWWTLGTIRNNYFLKCPGIDGLGELGPVGGGIYLLNGDQIPIIHNKIGIADATHDGNGIYLDVGCVGCLVAQNEASQGVVEDVKIPFVDKHGGDFNDWMCNQNGHTMVDPATVVS